MQAIVGLKSQDKNKLVAADAIAGMITGFAVSPLNTVVDKSVMEFANRKYPTIWQSATHSLKTLFFSPLKFMAGF